jgi:hypothetical protein
MREHSVLSQTSVTVINDISLHSKFIEITYIRKTFVDYIPIKLMVYEQTPEDLQMLLNYSLINVADLFIYSLLNEAH